MGRMISTPENLEILDGLVGSLRSLAEGETLAKKRIDNLAKGKYHLIAKARRTVEKEDGVIFATVIGAGIKKLPAANSYLVGERARGRATKGLKVAQGQIIGVVRNAGETLTAAERLRVNSELNKVGLAMEYCKE